MRSRLGVAAIGLGVVGAILCPAAIGLGWWTAVRTIDRANRIASRLNEGLVEANERLGRVENRLTGVQADLVEARGVAERLTDRSPELPEVRAEIDKFAAKLLPTVERAAELADSLRAVTTGLRALEDVLSNLGVEIHQPSRVKSAADAIDRGAKALDIPQEQMGRLKSSAALRLKQELVELTLSAAAGSDRLSEGLADSRLAVAEAQSQVEDYRSGFVFWVRMAAVAHTLAWLWFGLSQLSLINWGRRRNAA